MCISKDFRNVEKVMNFVFSCSLDIMIIPFSLVCGSVPFQELVRKGIPHHFRAIVWQLLCSAQNLPIKDQYSELLKMTSPCEKLIRRDIARTYPEHEFFKEKDSLGQEVLFNVMKVCSLEMYISQVNFMTRNECSVLLSPNVDKTCLIFLIS